MDDSIVELMAKRRLLLKEQEAASEEQAARREYVDKWVANVDLSDVKPEAQVLINWLIQEYINAPLLPFYLRHEEARAPPPEQVVPEYFKRKLLQVSKELAAMAESDTKKREFSFMDILGDR